MLHHGFVKYLHLALESDVQIPISLNIHIKVRLSAFPLHSILSGTCPPA